MLKLVGGSKMRNRIFTLSQNISTQYTYKWKKISTVKKPSVYPLIVMLTSSVVSQINKCFLICILKRTKYQFSIFPQKFKIRKKSCRDRRQTSTEDQAMK